MLRRIYNPAVFINVKIVYYLTNLHTAGLQILRSVELVFAAGLQILRSQKCELSF